MCVCGCVVIVFIRTHFVNVVPGYIMCIKSFSQEIIILAIDHVCHLHGVIIILMTIINNNNNVW